MIYKEYQEILNKFNDAQEEYNILLNEKETLFQMTQPKSVDCENERVKGGAIKNSFDSYLEIKEKSKIDERLIEIKSILDARKELLNFKEEQLRKSKDWNDVIYVYYYLENLSTYKIEKRIPYSQRQICRKLKEIKDNLWWLKMS